MGPAPVLYALPVSRRVECVQNGCSACGHPPPGGPIVSVGLASLGRVSMSFQISFDAGPPDSNRRGPHP